MPLLQNGCTPWYPPSLARRSVSPFAGCLLSEIPKKNAGGRGGSFLEGNRLGYGCRSQNRNEIASGVIISRLSVICDPEVTFSPLPAWKQVASQKSLFCLHKFSRMLKNRCWPKKGGADHTSPHRLFLPPTATPTDIDWSFGPRKQTKETAETRRTREIYTRVAALVYLLFSTYEKASTSRALTLSPKKDFIC